MSRAAEVIDKFRNNLIVSVQAQDTEPLNSPEHILALCKTVVNGGAAGLRLCGVENIKHVKNEVDVPIIGITKIEPTPINWLDSVYITPTMLDVETLLEAGVDCIAVDGTARDRVDGSKLSDQIKEIRNAGKVVLADVSTFKEGMVAAELGADMVATTLSGYTKHTRKLAGEGPDLDLLADLCDDCPVPVIMEGRLWDPEDVSEAFEYGAFAVVIGTAITRPHLITKRFISAIPEEEPDGVA